MMFFIFIVWNINNDSINNPDKTRIQYVEEEHYNSILSQLTNGEENEKNY